MSEAAIQRSRELFGAGLFCAESVLLAVAEERILAEDPAYQRMRRREMFIRGKISAGNADPDRVLRQITEPKISTHLWRAAFPTNLAPGTHQLRIRSTDMHGRTPVAYRIVRVTE